MRVTRLKLANVRAIKEAEFTFQPGFNLIVGVNGVGKTSALDALGVCLSGTVKHAVKRLTRTNVFSVQDIRIGAEALTVECELAIAGSQYTYVYHKPRVAAVPQKQVGMPRQQVHDTPERGEFMGKPPKHSTGDEPGGRPLAVYFSTRRAVATDRAPSTGAAAGGVPAAYAGAFSDRQLELGEFAAWMRVQQALKEENPSAQKVLRAFEQAVKRFLPTYSNLRIDENGDGPVLVINRGKTPVPVRQLSDGERGTLALVLDLTRRLSQANPNMVDPARKAEAVVLIDEIDLHLHPRWQRLIVDNLSATFPKCQFIATTHSPQVIGNVPHTGVTLLVDDGPPIRPAQTLGMDSNWILRHIMEADERKPDVQESLDAIIKAIRQGDIADARKQIATLRDRIGENPDLAAADAMASRAELLTEGQNASRRRKRRRKGAN